MVAPTPMRGYGGPESPVAVGMIALAVTDSAGEKNPALGLMRQMRPLCSFAIGRTGAAIALAQSVNE